MARQIRKKSGTGICHIMHRDVNRQQSRLASISFGVMTKGIMKKMITRTDPVILDASNLRGYKYYYDKANRLTRATYGEGSSLANYTGRFSENLTYDAHGNVKTITRYGKTSTGYGLMDNLTLSYNGNQLSGVSETVADYDVSGSFEYKKAKGSQYLYDNNGSLIADKSRGIAYITYDSNGNPSRIYFTNGSETRYVYSATGQKLTVEHYTAKPNITRQFGVKPSGSTQDQIIFAGHTDYLLGGRLVVKENIIRRLLFDGGYAAAAPVGSTTYGLALCHYNKDHLGNNREVVNSGGTVQQVTNYYPFGAPYADPAAVEHPSLQPYKYNGKELDTMHGLNTYDYGARQYNPVTLRWDRMDPLCEKYYSASPYVYCENNPIKFVDNKGFEKLDALDPNNSNNRSQIMAEKSFKDDANVINIWAHGSPNGMTIYDKESGENIRITNAEAFISYLNKCSSVWKKRDETGNVTIVLHSCNTAQIGENGKSFAQSLSENLDNAIIIAPTDNVYTYRGNELGTYKSSVEKNRTADGQKIVFSSEYLGNWVQYENGQQTRFYKGNTHPGEKGYNIVTSQSSLWEKIKYTINKYF